MEQKLLSIIVPVYNVEKYLQECVGSMMQTDMEQIEIVLVDDGSTDLSGTICDQLSAQYTSVCCIHKANSGVSKARNAGLSVAQGKYIAFVDADDRLAEGSIPEVLQWAVDADADVCFLQAVKFYPDGAKVDLGDGIKRDGVRGKEKIDVFRYLATRPKYPGSACTKLFKRNFLVANKLAFTLGRTNGEDLSFVMECLLAADSFDALDMSYYEYRQDRSGSASRMSTDKAFHQLSIFVSCFSSSLTQDGKAIDEISSCAMSFVAYEYMILLMFYGSLRKKKCSEVNTLYAYLKTKRWVMKYAQNKVGLWGKYCLSIIGIRMTATIIEFIKRA